MSDGSTRGGAWAAASCIAAMAFAIGVSACGDSGDDGGASASQGSTAGQTSLAADGGSDKEQVADVMRDLRTEYNSKDGKGFCSELTAGGQREVSKYAASVPKLKTKECATFITRFATRVVKSGAGHRPIRVKKVKVNGDKASIDMMGGLAGIRSTATYKLVKVNGQWKLVDPISGARTRRIEKN